MRRTCVSSVGLAIISLAFALPSSASPTVDLTTVGASGSINGALFEQYDGPHGAGTGHLRTFLVLQQRCWSGREEAYNTDASPLPLDAKEPAHTNALLLSDVPIVQRNGTSYREFVLDIHEWGCRDDRYLSLDQLMIARGDIPDPTGPVSSVFANAIYKMNDNGSENWIKLDGNLSSGGGQADMLALIPNTVFDNSSGRYVYLYSQFGVNCPANATPEEWSVRMGCGQPTIPAPAGILLAGLGAGFVGVLRRAKWF